MVPFLSFSWEGLWWWWEWENQVTWKIGIDHVACHDHFYRPTEACTGAEPQSASFVCLARPLPHQLQATLPFSDFNETSPQGGSLRGSTGLVVPRGSIKLAPNKGKQGLKESQTGKVFTFPPPWTTLGSNVWKYKWTKPLQTSGWLLGWLLWRVSWMVM